MHLTNSLIKWEKCEILELNELNEKHFTYCLNVATPRLKAWKTRWKANKQMNNWQCSCCCVRSTPSTQGRNICQDLIYSSALTASLMIIKESISGTQLPNPFISGGGLESATVLLCVTLWNHMEAIFRVKNKTWNGETKFYERNKVARFLMYDVDLWYVLWYFWEISFLDFTLWGVKSKLPEIILQLQEITSHFEVQSCIWQI